MTSFAIALSGILIYIIRAALESYKEYYKDGLSNRENNKQKAAVIFRTSVAPLALILGLVFMALASYQNAVGLNVMAQNFVHTHLSATFTDLGIGLAALSFICFGGLILWHCLRDSKDKGTRNSNRIYHAVIMVGALSAVFGVSLIAAAQVTDPLSITSTIPVNVTFWMTLAFTIVGVGVLIRDISQAYLNLHSTKQVNNDEEESNASSSALSDVSHHSKLLNENKHKEKSNKLIEELPILNYVIVGFVVASVALIGISAGLYDSVATINPTTTNLFKGSYGMLALGIACFGIAFILKAVTDFSRHDDLSSLKSADDSAEDKLDIAPPIKY